ncbi:MAG TPA: Ig-like domain-containing protein [Bacteroidia bacterium]|nr:Ig-like domain-containing protein [Bacteroidia bacterium]
MIFSKRTFLVFILTGINCLFYQCAQVIPLGGGPKDTKPPKLVSVTPANKSVNVSQKGTKIVFLFNEMITAPTAPQKLIINPLTEETPDVIVRGKLLVVEFTKPLRENTTYFMQFDNSVVDIHESNAVQDLTYMFSTGPSIDSSFITGKVIYALSQKPAARVSVMLYKNLSDTAPLRSKPDYMTKTDDDGKYFLSAVKPGVYQALALNDKSKNMIYDAGEAVGFLDKPLSVNNDTVNFTMSVAKAENVFVKKRIQPFWGLTRFVLSDTLPDTYIIAPKSVDADKISFENRNDTLEVYYKDLYDRNLELLLKKDKTTFDTVNLTLPSKSKTDSSFTKGMGKINVHTEKGVYGAKYDDVVLNFSLPVKNISAEKCFLMKDTIKEKPVLTAENKNEGKTLVTTYLPQYERRLINTLVPQATYTLMFLPQSLETFWGTFNKDTLKAVFKTFPSDEIGNLQVKLVLNDSVKAYVLQLMKANGTVINEFVGTNKKDISVNFYNLAAGEYSIRLINDRDENRKFSPSNFLKHIQAEPVFYYDKSLKIIAGWDIEAEWNMKNEGKK